MGNNNWCFHALVTHIPPTIFLNCPIIFRAISVQLERPLTTPARLDIFARLTRARTPLAAEATSALQARRAATVAQLDIFARPPRRPLTPRAQLASTQRPPQAGAVAVLR